MLEYWLTVVRFMVYSRVLDLMTVLVVVYDLLDDFIIWLPPFYERGQNFKGHINAPCMRQ
jgi:hypothetical protein